VNVGVEVSCDVAVIVAVCVGEDAVLVFVADGLGVGSVEVGVREAGGCEGVTEGGAAVVVAEGVANVGVGEVGICDDVAEADGTAVAVGV